MKIGILGTSNKENEKRFPLHIDHISNFSDDEISKLYFEKSYPGLKDNKSIGNLNICDRSELFSLCDLVILPKPTEKDFPFLRDNQILFGWVHCVQGEEITQIGIDKKLTYIAWEAMYRWNNDVRLNHIFQRNNELAGYCAVTHALSLIGDTAGSYGKGKKIAVIGYGSSGKGTIHALKGQGCTDLTVFSRRKKSEISDAITNVKYMQYENFQGQVLLNGIPSNQELLKYDIIVNCILQDTDNPINFLVNSDIQRVENKKLVIDVSCDNGFGFEFARPTSFENPILKFGQIIYYSVDHTPSFLWEAASYEISEALFPYVKYILSKGKYKGNEVLEKAVEIEDGKILNQKILTYQDRESKYPYKKMYHSKPKI